MVKNLLFSTLLIFGLHHHATAQTTNDAAITDIIMNDIYSANGNQVDVRLEFSNLGSNAISPITLNWSADGGATVHSWTLPFTIQSGNSLSLFHQDKIVFSNPGNYTNLMAWTSNPNNTTDGNPANDTLIKPIFVNTGNTVNRHVMIEEFTTAVCQFCPDGAYALENILFTHPDDIGLGIHAGFGTDAMTIPEHSTIAGAFTTSAPAAAIDRFRFGGGGNLATSTRGQWGTRVNTRNALGAPVDIIINGVQTSNNQYDVTVTANFVDYPLPGDIRVGLMIVEDSVSGTGSGYNQTNAYNNVQGHPYYGKGNPIIGYQHRHVVRAVYPSGNPWGKSGVIANNPSYNSSYSNTFSVSLNPNWDQTKVTFVAFAAYYGNSVDEREILNANKVKIGNLVTSIADIDKDLESLKVYPNPTRDNASIKFNLSQSQNIDLRIYDISGKEVVNSISARYPAGEHKETFNLSHLSGGVYFLKATIGGQQINKKLSIINQ